MRRARVHACLGWSIVVAIVSPLVTAAPSMAEVSAADAKAHVLRSSDVPERFGSIRADAAYPVNDGCFGWSRSWGAKRTPNLASSAVVSCPDGVAKLQFEQQFAGADASFRSVIIAGADQARSFVNGTYRSMDLLVGNRRATVIAARRVNRRTISSRTFKRLVTRQVARLR